MTVTVQGQVRTADHRVDSDSHLRLSFNGEQLYGRSSISGDRGWEWGMVQIALHDRYLPDAGHALMARLGDVTTCYTHEQQKKEQFTSVQNSPSWRSLL